MLYACLQRSVRAATISSGLSPANCRFSIMEGSHHHSSRRWDHSTNTTTTQGYHKYHHHHYNDRAHPHAHNLRHSFHNHYQRQHDYSQSPSPYQYTGVRSYPRCLPLPTPDFPPGPPCLGSHDMAVPRRYHHSLCPPNFGNWSMQPRPLTSKPPLLSPPQHSLWGFSQHDVRWNRDRQGRKTGDLGINNGPLQPFQHQYQQHHGASNSLPGGSELFQVGWRDGCRQGEQLSMQNRLDGRLPSQSLVKEFSDLSAASMCTPRKERTSLRSIPSNTLVSSRHGGILLSYSRSHHPLRPTVEVNKELKLKHSTRLSVLSYNVLSQSLLENNMYLYDQHHPDYLAWDIRKVNLLTELSQSYADILCLQEVEQEHYHSWFQPELARHGYSGRFIQRTGSYSDGSALFYKESKLNLVDWKGLEFQRRTALLNRDNVALLAKFAIVDTTEDALFCVAITHLLFNPKAGEVKLAQLAYLFAELHKMASNSGSEDVIPVLLCGDLNSTPHSYLINFITTSMLDYSNLSAKAIAGYFLNDERTRAIPKPLLPQEMCIGANCIYEDKGREEDKKREGVKHVTKDVECKSGQPDTICSGSQPKGHSEFKPEEKSLDCQLLKVTQSARGRRREALKTYKEVDISAVYSQLNSDSTGMAVKRTQDYLSPSKSSSSGANSVDDQATQVQYAEENAGQLLKVTHQRAADKSSESWLSCRAEENTTNPLQKVSSMKKEDISPSLVSSKGSPASGCGSKDSGRLSHPFKLMSAYPHPNPNLCMPSSVTTYHQNAFETVDYIFFSPMAYRTTSSGRQLTGFYLLQRLALPSTHTLLDLGPQPHKYLSSDHLLLQVSFQFSW